eukprot:2316193-Prymnesium_polylepis.1
MVGHRCRRVLQGHFYRSTALAFGNAGLHDRPKDELTASMFPSRSLASPHQPCLQRDADGVELGLERLSRAGPVPLPGAVG